jgi:Spy/CpxP family protein refolding chaperone
MVLFRWSGTPPHIISQTNSAGRASKETQPELLLPYQRGTLMNYRHGLVIIAAGILSVGLAVSVSAQTGAVPASPAQNPRGEGRMGHPDLNLTAEQKAQLQTMRQSQREQIMALRNDKNLSQEQRMAKVRAIREGSRQQLMGILTPQQQERIKTVRAEGRGAEGRERGRRGPAMNFTDDQRAKLKSIHQSTMEQVKAIRNDSTLTQEQRMAKLQSIHQNTRQQLSGILSPEQQQQMKEGRHGGRRGPGRFDGPRGRRGGRFGPGRTGDPAAAPAAQAPAKP